mmetsp:Transcript_242/g.769  ORF Transcript_242/g.769 Transcript_242/m.769 type:complete len:236 (+) Transcript_242:439-1146(+)
MPSRGNRNSPPSETVFKKMYTTRAPKRWEYWPCANTWPSGVMLGSHRATRNGSMCSRGIPAATAILCSRVSMSSRDKGRRSSSGKAQAMSAAASSAVKKPGITEIFGSRETVKAHNCPGCRAAGAPAASLASVSGSTMRQRSDAGGFPSEGPSSCSSKSLSTSSHCLTRLSLKKQFTPNFIPDLGGKPAWIVRLSSTLGWSTFDHITAQPFRGWTLTPRYGKYVSPPSPSATSFK